MSGQLRVVIADDHYLVREGVRQALERADDIRVVAAVGTATELESAVDAERPDVVVTDIRMPPDNKTDGIDAARRIRSAYPGTGVLVLSQYNDPSYARQLLEDGVTGIGYLLKERVADLDELGGAIRRVADGGSVIDPKVVEALIGVETNRESDALDRLTERERDVLAEMAAGKSNSSIGEALFISARSVEKHIAAIFTKLDLVQTEDAHRRVQAVLVHLGLGVTDRG